MSRRFSWLAGALLTLGTACTMALAQPQRPALPDLAYPRPPYYGVGGAGEQAAAAKLAKQLAKAEKADEKEKLRKELTEELGKQFDTHLQHQQKELEALEKQIADLKAIVKKRQDAKATIVERRLEQLVQEANGLGWNVPGTQRAGNLFGYSTAPPFPGDGQHTTTPKNIIPAKK